MVSAILVLLTANQVHSSVEMAPNQLALLVPPSQWLVNNTYQATKSPPNQRQGIFLWRQVKVDDTTYQHALKDLNGSKVTAIIRKTEDGKIEYWDMRGHTIPAQKIDLPPDVRDVLKPGCFSFRLTQPITRDRAKAPDHQFLLSGRFIERWNDHTDYWYSISVPSCPAVNVEVRIEGNYVVNELNPKPKSWVEFEGVRFDVVDDTKPPTVTNQSRRVVQTGGQPDRNYLLGVRPDWTTFLADNPRATKPFLQVSTQGFGNQEPNLPPKIQGTYVTANIPAQDWGAITISRRLILYGYIGGIPTRPRG